jgi:hypothetical protein
MAQLTSQSINMELPVEKPDEILDTPSKLVEELGSIINDKNMFWLILIFLTLFALSFSIFSFIIWIKE